jgi:hypothetical protein
LSLNWAAWRAHRQTLTVSISDTVAPASIPSPLSISQTVATVPLTSPQFKSADEVRRELELIEMRERALAAAVAKTENELKAVSIAEQMTVDDNASQPSEPLKSEEPEIASSSSAADTLVENIVDPVIDHTEPVHLIALVEQHEVEVAAARALLQSQQFELEIQREQLLMMKEAAEFELNEARQAEERLKQLKAMLADM